MDTFIKDKYGDSVYNMYLKNNKKNSYIKYTSVKSRQQLRLYTQYINNGNIAAYTNLVKMIFKIIRPEIRGNIRFMKNKIDNIIFNSKTDMEFYNSLREIYQNNSRKYPNTGISNYRDVLHATNVIDILNEKNVPHIPITKYLDIGCGDGKTTYEISKLLNNPKLIVYGADISEWEEKDNKGSMDIQEINFIQLDSDGKLPINSNEMDLITILQTLHHIKEFHMMISEIYRILKSGGILVVREHLITSPIDKLLIDIEHGLFAVSLNNLESHYDTYYAEYRSAFEHQYEFEKIGFKTLCVDVLSTKYPPDISPTRYGMMVFQKI